MLPAQGTWARADEAVTLHCDVRFATRPDLPVTWMFAKDASCTCVCKGVRRYSREDWAWGARPACTQLCAWRDDYR